MNAAKMFLSMIFLYTICFQLSASAEDSSQSGSTITSKLERLENADNSTVDNSTAEVEMTLKELEDNMKTFLGNIYRRAFPYVSKAGIPPGASIKCLLSLAATYFGFNRLEPWAFQLMDSSGKLSSGLLAGTSSALGNYDECQDVFIGGKPHPKAYRGSYCLLEIKPPELIINALKEYQANKGKGNIALVNSTSFLGVLRKIRTNPNHVMFRLGICMPSACNADDIQDIIDKVTSNLDVSVNVNRCEVKSDHEYQVYEILIMVFLLNIIALSVVGTLIEVIYHRSGCVSDDKILEPGPDVLKLNKTWRRSKLFEILSNFSLCSSTQKLVLCDPEEDALDVIRGIKLLTVILAIYTHTYALPHRLHLYRFRDTLNFTKFIDEVLFGTIANGSVGVDTFFFIAGFIFIYYRWRLFKRPPIFNYILKFLGVNYIRMVAAQILVVFIFALFPLFGSGPLWHEFVEEPLENCAKTGWYNIFYIQNFLGPYDSCMYHTWILATMMQLFIFTAFVVWLFYKKPIIGIVASIVLIVIGIISVSVVTVTEDFPATFTIYFYDFRTSVKYFKYLYVQSYNHVGPFCIGMLVAYYIAENPPLKTKKPVIISLWVASCVTCLSIIFGLYHYREEREMNKELAVFYSALHRPAWGLAIGWIVYACATDNGGFIRSILTWKALIPLERLCYLAYLLHIPIMYYHGGVQRERMFMGHYNQVMCFFSYLVASFLLSSICYIFFQYPYQTIESYIFGKHKENIWQVSDNMADSTDTLETETSEKQTQEDNSRVLYSRYDQNIPFSEVN